ncbi:MAG: hypothetical protein IJE92_00440, partial [Clostridia bacterium]|nr:hypothetical protein [Clostridia bacterium]
VFCFLWLAHKFCVLFDGKSSTWITPFCSVTDQGVCAFAITTLPLAFCSSNHFVKHTFLVRKPLVFAELNYWCFCMAKVLRG